MQKKHAYINWCIDVIFNKKVCMYKHKQAFQALARAWIQDNTLPKVKQ